MRARSLGTRQLLLCNNTQHTFIIVCVTHSQAQNSERLGVGECGSKLHKPPSLWCVWCENLRLLFPVSQDFTAACKNWGCKIWGCKIWGCKNVNLSWSKEQRYREGTTQCEALSMGMRSLLFHVYWLHQLLVVLYKCQLGVLLPEGKHAIKKQLYSEPFTLWEAASFIFYH